MAVIRSIGWILGVAIASGVGELSITKLWRHREPFAVAIRAGLEKVPLDMPLLVVGERAGDFAPGPSVIFWDERLDALTERLEKILGGRQEMVVMSTKRNFGRDIKLVQRVQRVLNLRRIYVVI